MVWLGYEWAWGGSYKDYYKEQSLNGTPIDKDHLQPLEFQGQFFDPETSLHYNRFRYYDSDVGMFIQRDPIGLLGGINIYQYADNPTFFIDPFGLKSAKVHAKLYAQKINTQIRKGQKSISSRPTTVAAVKDRKTQRVFYGESGKENIIEHPELKKSLPKYSSEDWGTTNCAEVNALNKALKARPNAKMEDFEIAAATTKSEKSKKPCKNCAITTKKCH